MNIIEEHRTEVRVGINKYPVEVAALSSDDQSMLAPRVAVTVGAVGPEGESVADGRIEVDARVAPTLGSVLADTRCFLRGNQQSQPSKTRGPSSSARPALDRRTGCGTGTPVAGRGKRRRHRRALRTHPWRDSRTATQGRL